MKDIHVVFNCDNAYLKYIAVTIVSVISNSKNDESLHFHILHSGVEHSNVEKINKLKKIKDFKLYLYHVDSSTFPQAANFGNCKLNESNYRLLIADMLSVDIDKAIYLDGDTIVCSSLSELYEAPINEHYICAVRDNLENPFNNITDQLSYLSNRDKKFDLSKYFNSGVLLVNLKKWREDRCSEGVLKMLNDISTEAFFPDQDALNAVFNHNVKLMSEEWNFPVWKPILDVKPKIIHYTVYKPWLHPVIPFGDIYWQYAHETDFYDEILLTVVRPHSLPETLKCHMKVIYNNVMLMLPFFNKKKYHISLMKYHDILEGGKWYANRNINHA